MDQGAHCCRERRRVKRRPGCLASHRGLSYWEPVAFPASFLSSQEISVTDSPQDLLSLFAERAFDHFGDSRRLGGSPAALGGAG